MLLLCLPLLGGLLASISSSRPLVFLALLLLLGLCVGATSPLPLELEVGASSSIGAVDSPRSCCCRHSSWPDFVCFVPFSAALSRYSFMRLMTHVPSLCPSASPRFAFDCLAVPRSNDMHPGHLAVNPHSSKFSREMQTLRKRHMLVSSFLCHGTISKLLRSHLSLAGFLHTILVSQTPFRFPTMTSAAVALTPK